MSPTEALRDYVGALEDLLGVLDQDQPEADVLRRAFAATEAKLAEVADARSGEEPFDAEGEALARRAAELNALAAQIALGRADHARAELGRVRQARSRFSERSSGAESGRMCDLAG